MDDPNYVWHTKCNGKARGISGRTLTEVDIDGTMLDVEASFCCLGDNLCSGGDCDSAIAAIRCVACEEFRKLIPVLTTWHLSPRKHSKLCKACGHSVMLHGSENAGNK